MFESEIDLATATGAMNTFVVRPDEKRYPVVLFYMDAPGIRDELRDMARRLARAGYLVMLPNLYYRTTREFRARAGEDGLQEIYAMRDALSIDMIMSDTAALLAHANTDPNADEKRIGAVGYCMSGAFVVAAAAHFPDKFSCAASFFGTRLVTDRPDSPHRQLNNIRTELYLGFAENDELVPAKTVETFQRHLDAAGVSYELEWYPGTGHGFAFPSRRGKYVESAAEHHWEQMFALFKRKLD